MSGPLVQPLSKNAGRQRTLEPVVPTQHRLAIDHTGRTEARGCH
jgi:hypothetical protein